MDVFETIIAPFIFIIEQLFLFSYKLSGNYGVAIILLSFFISLLLLPIFVFIEKAKKKDDAIKLKMQPLVDEIKRCYKGQERYYYIRTLNRQYNYSPTRALIPILSLLVQIPFFIAAYQFVENYAALEGVGFAFIQNLNAPDALFGKINFLPIAMTLVNIITAYFYTRNGNTAERKQMLVIAGVFLVLLFNLPSGLVLYWTMNNVFSFFRLFVTNKEVFRKIEHGNEDAFISFSILKAGYKHLFVKLKYGFFFLALLGAISQLNWAYKYYHFDDLALRLTGAVVGSFIVVVVIGFVSIIVTRLKPIISKIKVSPLIYFSLLFLTAYFFFSAKFYFTGTNSNLAILANVFLIPLELISVLYFTRYIKKINIYLYPILFGLLLALFAFQLVSLKVILNNGKPSDISFLNIIFSVNKSSFINIWYHGIIFIGLCSPFYILTCKNKFSVLPNPNSLVYYLSMLYIAGSIFYWNPLIVYSSFPANFSFPAINFFSNNFKSFILVLIVGVFSYLLVPKKYKFLMQISILSALVITFLYSSIIPFDFGTLEVNFFSNEKRLAARVLYYILEAVLILAVIIGVVWIVKRQYSRNIIIIVSMLNLFIIGQSLYLAINTGVFFSKNVLNTAEGGGSESIKIPFSKDQENVLYFMIDGAQGWYIHDLIEEDSSLVNDFNGFVWYPNTVATSNYTYASIPSMIAGPDYTIESMNKVDSVPIVKKITKSTELFYEKVTNKGYYFTGNSLKYSSADHSLIENHLPEWSDSWNEFMEIDFQNEMWYTRLWENAIFSSVPLFLKPRIYNNNKWILKENVSINSSELNKYNFVRLLPEISHSDSEKPNFIYIQSMFNHVPWDLITEDNKFVRDVSPYENQRWFIQLFVEWMNWMKENDVYDNTKIILVSDHGPSWWHYHKGLEKGLPIVWDEEKKVSLMEFLRLNSLLMVKDFDSKGDLKEDWRLMCNYDAYNIAFNENDPTKLDSTDRTVKTFYTKWHTDLKSRKKYFNNLVFEVQGNSYDLKNWKQINIE